MDTPPRTWVLADDRTGNVNQAIGVALALGWPFTVKDIRYRRRALLPNWLLARSATGLCRATSSPLAPPWPDLVIAAGRRSAPIARWLKARHPEAFLVQLMWPGSAADLDLIAVPEHDRVPDLRGLVRTIGAPHRITPAGLAAAAAGFAEHHAELPRPWIACLVGGRRRSFGFE
ncbi:MAG: ELM1/GtrOC1 family putative glycosyltransferase, partial [Geminicoccaceae bacterium]